MSPSEAKTLVDRLYTELYHHWEAKIDQGPFMSQLRAGKLPLSCIRRFFKDWGLFSVEVVALNAVSYYVHLPFFIRNFDLLPAFTDKIAEELIFPKPPGHTLLLVETASGLGLSREELFGQPASPAGRAISDYCRRIFQDGSVADLWGLHVYEETLGHWSKQWAQALTSHYELSRQQAVYFTAHAEADLVQHEGRMGHGPLNRMILQRILEQGETASRLGYDLKYCAFTMVDLHSLMERNALENPYPA
ncbi:MAG: iron-containing redox enzyme family protein [Deltaproteobacteria bacterium]|nr:iron-containing redox enzyme family protein [Deltaproteobacteria bacterium]MBI2991374.1 iron-containing redox enzyme family protein [Deltaproteobacteria bacterium]